ncbi:zinc-binding metallopeptidase family protein [Membranihabitans maritimus]|uniref:zinc-binding metallopeptidase family protein n=1 Tax=Membranihabitans maritimus TaxID=2904244 RepID=UPI001F2EC959|nr:putative zinc-binding metallopeptidase [Membranihabitans maritimus]
MQIFRCTNCSRQVYFENTMCSNCGQNLGFNPLSLKMITLHRDNEGRWMDEKSGQFFHYCTNSQFEVCNWIINNNDPAQFCIACSLNQTIPDLSRNEFLIRWRTIENAKHRLIYSLLKWDLPVISKTLDSERGLSFNFKSDDDMPGSKRVLTGHSKGNITMNIAEADDVEREMARNKMDEVYRTVLGHFRHEIGHYYWEIFVKENVLLQDFRRVFGDETIDYQQSLEKYYQEGAPDDWNQNYISAYATMHPWEDWAETWSHYMHIVDTLETAQAFELIPTSKFKANSSFAYANSNFEEILESWVPLTLAMNSLNRSMGAKDLYPFVINASSRMKLKFVHDLIHGIDSPIHS